VHRPNASEHQTCSYSLDYIYFNLHIFPKKNLSDEELYKALYTIIYMHAGLRHDGGRTSAVDVFGVRQGAIQGEVRRVRDGGAQRGAEDRRP
jgi:hypothetical protein